PKVMTTANVTADRSDPSPQPILRGPRGHWLLGCAPQLRRDLLGFAMQANREYGHYVRIRLFPGFPIYLLTHPDAVEHVLQKNQRNYRNPDIFNRSMGLLIGNGL